MEIEKTYWVPADAATHCWKRITSDDPPPIPHVRFERRVPAPGEQYIQYRSNGWVDKAVPFQPGETKIMAVAVGNCGGPFYLSPEQMLYDSTGRPSQNLCREEDEVLAL